MASRWRTWDKDFATDILENKLHFDSLDSMPIGSRGKFVFNISPKMLTIPIIHSLEKSDVKVGGRGKRLKDQNQPVCASTNKLNNKNSTIKKINNQSKLSQNFHQKEFPSLSESSGKAVKNVKKETKIQVSHETPTQTLEDLILQFQDAESSERIETENDSLHLKDQNEKMIIVDEEGKELDEDCDEIQENNDLVLSEKDFDTKYTSQDSLQDYEKEVNSVVSNTNSESSFCKGLEMADQSFSSTDFLESLEGPEYYILIEGLTKEVDTDLFKELISSFGEIELFLSNVCSDGIHQDVIVKMIESSHCDWVISCLDGDIYEEDGKRLSARSVDAVLNPNSSSFVADDIF